MMTITKYYLLFLLLLFIGNTSFSMISKNDWISQCQKATGESKRTFNAIRASTAGFKGKVSCKMAYKNIIFSNSLDIKNKNISDLSPLEELTNLVYLDLRSNHISDVSFLKKLTNLEVLRLNNNQVSDINYLSDLTRLTNLYLSNNPISDLNELSDFIRLERLEINNALMTDLKSIMNFKNLVWLSIENNNITDLSPLRLIKEMSYLKLSSNNISNIKPLSNLKKLKILDISENPISNLKPIEHVKFITFRNPRSICEDQVKNLMTENSNFSRPQKIYEEVLNGEKLTKNTIQEFFRPVYIKNPIDLWFAHNALVLAFKQQHISFNEWGSEARFKFEMIERIYSNIKNMPKNSEMKSLYKGIAISAEENGIINNAYDLIQDWNLENFKDSTEQNIRYLKKELKDVQNKVNDIEKRGYSLEGDFDKIVTSLKKQKKIRLYGAVAKTVISIIPFIGNTINMITDSGLELFDLSNLSNIDFIFSKNFEVEGVKDSVLNMFKKNKEELVDVLKDIGGFDIGVSEEEIIEWVNNQINEGLDNLPDLIDEQINDQINSEMDKLADDLTTHSCHLSEGACDDPKKIYNEQVRKKRKTNKKMKYKKSESLFPYQKYPYHKLNSSSQILGTHHAFINFSSNNKLLNFIIL